MMIKRMTVHDNQQYDDDEHEDEDEDEDCDDDDDDDDDGGDEEEEDEDEEETGSILTKHLFSFHVSYIPRTQDSASISNQTARWIPWSLLLNP